MGLVVTNGCCDLLHLGHVSALEWARAQGDALIVLINSDQQVRELKGPERPIITARQRARMVAALECVDRVVIFTSAEPAFELAGLRPKIYVKGAEWEGKIPDTLASVVETGGGEIRFAPRLDGLSTTGIIDRIKRIGS